MTIITESLISEFQSPKSIQLNDVLRRSYQKSIDNTTILGIPFDINNNDVRKIIIHNIIIDICEFKKTIDRREFIFYIREEEFNGEYLNIINDIFKKMELHKSEKSKTFFKSFTKYLKSNGFDYITNVYLKQATNKLALYR